MIKNGECHIPLGRGLTAVVDVDRFEEVSRCNWTHARCGKNHIYAMRRGPDGKGIYLHRLICGANKGQVVDHINGDTLDNRASNLRICSHAENARNQNRQQRNKSGFKGVSWIHRDQRWMASIRTNGKTTNLGTFMSPQEAAVAYDRAASALFGEFANINFRRPAQLSVSPPEEDAEMSAKATDGPN